MDDSLGFGTRAIHAGCAPDPSFGAVMTPLYMTSTYAQSYPAKPIVEGYDYSRAKNPTRTAWEQNLASLEKAKTGHAFGSGLAALAAIMHLLKSGDHVVAGNDLYGGTRRQFERIFRQFGIDFTYVDPGSADAVRAAVKDETRLIWVETPTNPLLGIADLKGIAAIGKDHDVLLACDNTFATPFLQNPLELGFDIVAHSTTKYLGGHSDIIGGVLAVRDEALSERLTFIQLAVGAIPSPMDCFLALRGAKTLHLRMERHCKNAREVVAFLQSHPRVAKIYYPGLPDHPNHEIAKGQMRDFGGMISFVLDTSVKEAMETVTRTKIFTLAESLGGVESLIEHPPSMTHASVPAEERKKIGIDDGLIRLSVGVEDANDLIDDLRQALPE